jgi:hypothetical protein
VLAIGNRTEAPGCLVEAAVNAAMSKAFAAALLLTRFGVGVLPRSPPTFAAGSSARVARTARFTDDDSAGRRPGGHDTSS